MNDNNDKPGQLDQQRASMVGSTSTSGLERHEDHSVTQVHTAEPLETAVVPEPENLPVDNTNQGDDLDTPELGDDLGAPELGDDLDDGEIIEENLEGDLDVMRASEVEPMMSEFLGQLNERVSLGISALFAGDTDASEPTPIELILTLDLSDSEYIEHNDFNMKAPLNRAVPNKDIPPGVVRVLIDSLAELETTIVSNPLFHLMHPVHRSGILKQVWSKLYPELAAHLPKIEFTVDEDVIRVCLVLAVPNVAKVVEAGKSKQPIELKEFFEQKEQQLVEYIGDASISPIVLLTMDEKQCTEALFAGNPIVKSLNALERKTYPGTYIFAVSDLEDSSDLGSIEDIVDDYVNVENGYPEAYGQSHAFSIENIIASVNTDSEDYGDSEPEDEDEEDISEGLEEWYEELCSYAVECGYCTQDELDSGDFSNESIYALLPEYADSLDEDLDFEDEDEDED